MSQKKSVVPAKTQSGSEPDILDAKEACRYLRISLRTLRRYTTEGRITFLRYSAQALRFRKADLDAFLESVMVKSGLISERLECHLANVHGLLCIDGDVQFRRLDVGMAEQLRYGRHIAAVPMHEGRIVLTKFVHRHF